MRFVSAFEKRIATKNGRILIELMQIPTGWIQLQGYMVKWLLGGGVKKIAAREPCVWGAGTFICS
jgi:hypothetical protein